MVMRMFSYAIHLGASRPGGTTMVESSCSTIAGPVEASMPAGSVVAVVDGRVDGVAVLVEVDRPAGHRVRAAPRRARARAGSARAWA